VTEFSNLDSSNMTPTLHAALARAVESTLADSTVKGVVLTHGTDTMEESAFSLDLLLAVAAPVVRTGAMRIPGSPGADGPRNLLDAGRAAGSQDTRELGVVVGMNDEIHAARYVTKTHASAVDAFKSPGVEPPLDKVECRSELRLDRLLQLGCNPEQVSRFCHLWVSASLELHACGVPELSKTCMVAYQWRKGARRSCGRIPTRH
jgi:L-asparaginase/Glu-tRNA(Gln) amidotransferase subunit D